MQDDKNDNTKISNTFLSGLSWRCAVKNFDQNRKLNADEVQSIKDAIRLAPTSFGVQPFRVIVVENDELKLKLKAASFNQTQIDSCSQLFIFIADLDIQKHIGEYCDLAFQEENMIKRVGVESMIRGALLVKSKEETLRWVTDQSYLALGFALAACAELRIDSCPMEGFSESSYKEILGLNDDEVPCVILAIGYRVEDPAHDKVRFTEEKMFEMR